MIWPVLRAQEASDVEHITHVNSFAIFSTDSWIMIKYQGKNSCFLTFGKIGTMIARMYIFRKVFALIQSNLADSWHAWE